MAKNPCRADLSKMVSRELTEAEANKIREDINNTARMLWRTDRAKMQSLSKADQQRYAANVAAAKIRAQAIQKQRNLAKNLEANARNLQYIRSRESLSEGVANILAADPKVGKGAPGTTGIEAEGQAIANMALSELIDIVEAANGKFFGLIEDADQLRGLFHALWGKTEGIDPKAVNVAKAWGKVTDWLREKAIRAGADIGDLGDTWHLPQTHDTVRMLKSGKEAWVEFMRGRLDRSRYVDEEGVRISDEAYDKMLGDAFVTITRDGENKTEPTGQRGGSGSITTRLGHSRALFFKDADAHLSYLAEFGGKNVYATMISHIQSISRDIAMMERLGPNALANARLLIDEAAKADKDKPMPASAPFLRFMKKYPALDWQTRVEKSKAFNESLLAQVAGTQKGAADAPFAQNMAAFRSWLVAARLGSAVVSSITDHATMIQTARMWNIPVMQIYRNYWGAMNPMNPEELRALQRHGLALNVMINSLDRFSGEYGGVTSAKVANAVMRASGLSAMTEAPRRAFSATMMSTIGHIAKTTEWENISPDDMRIFKAKGVTREVFEIWRKSKNDDDGFGGSGMISGRTIMDISDADIAAVIGESGDITRAREDAATKLMAMVLEEQDMAVISPGARERAMLYGEGEGKGTVRGEIWRSFMQFKTFPVAMMTRHWKRSMSVDLGTGKYGYQYRGRVANMASLFAMATMFGAMAMELKAIISGKDPQQLWGGEPEDLAKTWAAAALQGGAIGIFGDFLNSTTSRGGSDFMSVMSGPTFGMVGDVANLTFGNMSKASMGEETDVIADSVRVVQGLTPGASLWYARAVFSNMVFGQFQEMASPGYLDRIRRKTARETGQQYWWNPGELAPDRAPNLSAAIGGE